MIIISFNKHLLICYYVKVVCDFLFWCDSLQNLVELFKPYSDVLACTIDRDYHGKSLGTAVVRSSLEAFYYNTINRVLLIIRHTTHVLSKNPLELADFPANVIWCLCVLQYCKFERACVTTK